MKWGYPIACKIWNLSRDKGDIDIHAAKRNSYAVHLFHINTIFLHVQKIIKLAIVTFL